MANNENLKPIKPGEVRNPKGKPKGTKNRSTIARKWLEATDKIKNPLTGKVEELSQEDIMTLALIRKARRGNVSAYKELMDSSWGKATQNIQQVVQQGVFKGIDLNIEEDENGQS